MKSFDDPTWLRVAYIDQERSTYDIAREMCCDPKSVYTRLKKFGIPTRPRGQNLKGADNFMAKPGVVNPFKGRRHSAETKEVLARKASVPKPYLKGKRNGMYGRNGPSNPNYKDGSSPERQRAYAGSEWKEILREVYRRDGFRCVRCFSPKKTRKGLHAHHIWPWAGNPDLRFDPDNLVTLCKSCHSWVHSTENTLREYLA